MWAARGCCTWGQSCKRMAEGAGMASKVPAAVGMSHGGWHLLELLSGYSEAQDPLTGGVAKSLHLACLEMLLDLAGAGAGAGAVSM